MIFKWAFLARRWEAVKSFSNFRRRSHDANCVLVLVWRIDPARWRQRAGCGAHWQREIPVPRTHVTIVLPKERFVPWRRFWCAHEIGRRPRWWTTVCITRLQTPTFEVITPFRRSAVQKETWIRNNSGGLLRLDGNSLFFGEFRIIQKAELLLDFL